MRASLVPSAILFLFILRCAIDADEHRAVGHGQFEFAAASDRTAGAEGEAISLQRCPEPAGRLLLTYGPYAHHTGRGNYNSRSDFRALEWEFPSRWSVGGATFDNSFSQRCEYGFLGRRLVLKHRSGRFFMKLTGGIIHGYEAPHRNAVPLNWGGFNPALIPSLGYEYKGVSFQFAVFGRAWGAMPMIGCALR
jgi:hypothetical protein